MGKKSSVKKPIFKKPSAKKLQIATQRRNLVSLIKSVNLKQSETKYLSKLQQFTNRFTNQLYAIRLWGDSITEANNVMPLQGNTDASRNGDSIIATGYKVRYALELNGLYSQSEIHMYFLPYNSDQGDPTDRAQLYHLVSGIQQLDPIQTKRWKGIKLLRKLRIRSTDANYTGNRMIQGSVWIPLKKKLNFKADTSNITTNLKENGIILWYFTGYNTTPNETTTIVNATFVPTLYFKDP